MYQQSSGTISLKNLRKGLVSLGIWSDEILRAMPPMYLNTYLPIALLEHIDREKFPDEKSNDFIDYFIRCYIPNEYTKSLNHLDPEFDYLRDKKLALAEDNLDVEEFISELRRLNLELNLNNILVKKEAETEPMVTLRLAPKLTRYLSAVRDLTLEQSQRLLPSRSPAGSLARYLLPDIPGKPVNNPVPTFSKANDKLRYLRFVGLLPDEDLLNFSSFLRIILMSDCSYEELRSRISGLCNLAGMNLDDFNKNSQIERILEQVYTSEITSNFKESSVVCSGSSILRNRIVLSIDLVGEILSNTPSKWANELPAVEYWEDLVENVFSDIVSHRNKSEITGWKTCLITTPIVLET